MTGSSPGYCDECGSALKMGICPQCSGIERQRETVTQREILQLLTAGYSLRLNNVGAIEAAPPEVEIEGILSNPDKPNPLSKQDRHRYR